MSFEFLAEVFSISSLLWFMVFLALIPINWALEARKWQVLFVKYQKITLKDALKMVLSGVGLGLVIPFGLGEYFGRISHFEKTNLMHYSAGAAILNGFMQLLPTMIFGVFSTVILLVDGYTQAHVTLIISVGALFLIVFILWKRRLLFGLIEKAMPDKLNRFIIAFKNTGQKTIAQLAVYSFVRYAVFTFQFYVAFMIFKIEIPFSIQILGIFWVFFMKSIIPKLSELSDGAVRTLSASFFFNYYGYHDPAIIMVVLFIWILNVLGPGFFGAYFISNSRESK